MDSKRSKMREDFINQTRKYVKSLPRDYYPLLLGSVIFFIVSIFVPNVRYLYLSPTRPWSIFTYMFVYDGYGNIELFILLFFFYLFASYRFSDVWKLKMTRFLTVSMFVIAILSGIYWVILFPKSPGYGQSGVVYALYGMIFVLCILNPLFYLQSLFDFLEHIILRQSIHRNYSGNFMDPTTSLISVLFFICIIIQLYFSKTYFFNEHTGIGYPLHEVSFLLGIFFGILGYFLVN